MNHTLLPSPKYDSMWITRFQFLEEYLRNGNLCLIEWPEIAIKMIDKDFIHIKLKEISKNKRSIEIKSL